MKQVLSTFLIIATVFFFSPQPTRAAVPLIENTTTKSQTSGTSISLSHTATGSDLLAVVQLSHRYGADGVTGCTYDGNAMTRAIGAFTFSGAYIYYLENASSGTVTVTCNFIVASNSRGNAIAVSTITGADMSGALDDTGSNGASSGNSATVDVTSTKNDCIIVDALTVSGGGAPSITGGQTLLYSGSAVDALSGTHSWGLSYEDKATAGSEILSWSWTGTAEWQVVAAAFCAGAGGGGGSTSVQQDGIFFD